MDYSTLQSRVCQYLDRSDLTTHIQNWINDTRKDIALKYDFDYLYVEATTTTSAGSATYALPTDYMGHLVMMSNSKKLSRIGAREFDELIGIDEATPDSTSVLSTESGTTSGPPEYYIDRGMQFELFPSPDTAYTITLKYYAQPSDFTIAADSDYISVFHFEAVIFGAALRGAIFLDDVTKIAIFTSAYDTKIKEMVKKEFDKIGKDTHVRWKTWKDYDLDAFKRLMRIDNG